MRVSSLVIPFDVNSDGASALHISSMNGHVDATRALLKLGATPEVGVAPEVGRCVLSNPS